MKATLVKKEAINYNVTTFWWKPEKPIQYTAGQFIEMYLPHKNPDKRGVKHWFTLSSSPTEELISNTTKFAGTKSSTFKKTLFSLEPGDSVEISEAMGDFVLPKDKTIPLVFVAGGIGLTPFRSMVKWLLDTKESRDIQVLLAASGSKDIVFKDLFETYGIKPIILVTNPSKGWKGEIGQLTGPRILTLVGGSTEKRIYISGPELMVETLHAELLKLGVHKDQLVGDYFPGYPSI